MTPAPSAGPSNVPTPPSSTARKLWIKKRTPRSANIEKSGTTRPPASPASAAPPVNVSA